MPAFRVVDSDEHSKFSIVGGDLAATGAQLRLFTDLQVFLDSLNSLDITGQTTPFLSHIFTELRDIAATKLIGDDKQVKEGFSQLQKIKEEYNKEIPKRSTAAGAFRVEKDEKQSSIDFIVRPSLTVPQEQADLLTQIQKILTVVRIFLNKRERSIWWWSGSLTPNTDKARWNDYLNQLVGISKLGLESDPAQLDLAWQQLDGLREQVVMSEAGLFKNNYMRRFRSYVLAGSTALLVMYILTYVESSWTRSTISYIGAYRNFAILLLGACWGAWLSFGIRKVDILFADLAMLEQDRLDPPVRILFVCGLSVIIGLLFATEAVAVTIGKFNTNFLAGESAVPRALLIGLLCGVSEQALATAVTRRASEFLSGIAGVKDQSSHII